jgi:thioesterase domain-containing protein
VAQIYSQLEARYQPPVLPEVPVLLVRASVGVDADTPYREIYRDADFGWQRVAGRLELADVTGGHASMLQEQHVDALCMVLRRHLERWAGATGDPAARMP